MKIKILVYTYLNLILSGFMSAVSILLFALAEDSFVLFDIGGLITFGFAILFAQLHFRKGKEDFGCSFRALGFVFMTVLVIKIFSYYLI